MIRGRVVGALVVGADDGAAAVAREPPDRMPIPTLDERASLYLRAVYGDLDFTNEEHSRARNLMLTAMAADIAARSGTTSHDDVSLSAGFLEPLTVLPNPFLEIAPLESSYEPETSRRSAGGVDFREHQLGHQAGDESRVAEAALARLQESRASPRRRLPPVLPAWQLSRRTAAACAAAALAAVAVLWLAGIFPAAWFGSNAPSRDELVVMPTRPPEPSDGTPQGRGPLVTAEAQRELNSALNTAQLRPEEIAALFRRGQELIADGKFRLARSVLEQAAEAGSALAALAIGRTYDPLEGLGVRRDAPPDVALARAWYEKAKDLGSAEAARRLGQLSPPAARRSNGN